MEAKHGLDRILPVMDLKRGQVVHAIAGNRQQYGPLTSQLVDSIHPARVAKALCERVACSEIYVADLDAIAGDAPDYNSYAAIENTGAGIWLDAGVGTSAMASRFIEKMPQLRRLIVGLETLSSLRELEAIRDVVSAERLVFSLDLREGLPVTEDRAAKRMSAESIAAYAIDEGIQSFIVLDVATVGSGSGGETTVDLCRNIRSRHLDIELTSGGGVRHEQDVQRFLDAGCDRVLVATALHSGSLFGSN